jgi:hypothetical protein
MVDTNATMAFLEQATDLRETAQVTTFSGFRTTKDGSIQEVTIDVLDRGGRAGAERYRVSFRSDDGRGCGSGDYFATVEEAIGVAMVHWGQLG